eukprot:SAG31_NODE_343_length_17426_cov_35.294443_13_plen_170_part_00
MLIGMARFEAAHGVSMDFASGGGESSVEQQPGQRKKATRGATLIQNATYTVAKKYGKDDWSMKNMLAAENALKKGTNRLHDAQIGICDTVLLIVVDQVPVLVFLNLRSPALRSTIQNLNLGSYYSRVLVVRSRSTMHFFWLLASHGRDGRLVPADVLERFTDSECWISP